MMTWLECRIPPPVLALLCGLGMAQAAARWPQWPLSMPVGMRGVLLVGLLLLAILLDGSSVWAFIRRHTTINPMKPQTSSQLVVTGFYRYSRNPMYLGMLCLLLAWGLWLGQAVAFAGPLLWALWIDRLQIVPEERALQARFGAAYTTYCQAVRRWL